ncbi:hypothetical protein [Hymenobacter coalescens]
MDTALNVRWQTRLPAGRSGSSTILRVHRQPDGTLLAATYDDTAVPAPANVPTPYLYIHRLLAAGQWLSRRELRAGPGTPWIRAYDWQALAGDSVAVAVGSAPVGGGPQAGWIARLRATAPRQVTALAGPGAAPPAGALEVYPNPAAGAAARVALPAGLGPGATLTLRDALGRPLRGGAHRHRRPPLACPAAAPLARPSRRVAACSVRRLSGFASRHHPGRGAGPGRRVGHYGKSPSDHVVGRAF